MSEPAGRCPYPHRPAGEDAPHWHDAARRQVHETAERSAPSSHVDETRAVAMGEAAVEARARQQGVQDITDLFVRTLGKKLGHGHPLSERTGLADFAWTPEALARLDEVPEFCRELTRWRVEWTAYKLGLGTTITPEVMQVKYEMWGRVSHRIRERREERLSWADDALDRFARVPDFVKGQVLEAVEGNARALGATQVDSSVVDRVIDKWRATGDFHEGLYGFR